MIEIKNVDKKFGKTDILKNVNCTIKNHSIYGLVGANGTGKSTLLRLIMGIYQKDKGSIKIDGMETYDCEKIKQEMVFVPDDLFFYSGYTLLDMRKYYQAMYDKFDINYLLELAKSLKLNLNQNINTFSKGMKRQCALILALSTRCKYLFFDETFDGLDPVIRLFFKKQLAKQMEEDSSTIVLTSHNLRELEDICDHLGLLYQGDILFESEIDSLKTDIKKVQISLQTDYSKETFKDLDIISFKKSGSVASMIINDKDNTAMKKLKKLNPTVLDFLPLTLEEVFIYEMEALGYEFNQII